MKKVAWLVLLIGSIFMSLSCAHTKLQYTARLESRSNEDSGIEFTLVDYHTSYWLPILCGASFWLYGGACWAYLFDPMAEDLVSFGEKSRRLMRQKFSKREWTLLSSDTEAVGYKLAKGPSFEKHEKILWYEEDGNEMEDRKIIYEARAGQEMRRDSKARSRRREPSEAKMWIYLEGVPFEFTQGFVSYHGGLAVSRNIGQYGGAEFGISNGEVGQMGRGSISDFAKGSWHLESRAGLFFQNQEFSAAGGLMARRFRVKNAQREYYNDGMTSDAFYWVDETKYSIENLGAYARVALGINGKESKFDFFASRYWPMHTMQLKVDTPDTFENNSAARIYGRMLAESPALAFGLRLGFLL